MDTVLETPPKKKKKRIWKFIKIFLFCLLAIAIIGGGAFAGYLATMIKRAPDLNLNAITNMAATTKVYDADGQYMFALQGDGDRDLISSLDQVSPHIVNAFIAAEDKNFRDHFGINPIAFTRAAVQNLIGGGIVSGASTITQQTIKNAMFPEQERTLERKVQEMYLAIQLEKQLTKDEIMVTYLNWIYFGKSGPDNLYGIERASKAIFGKSAKDLNLAQSTIVSALPNNPSIFDTGENLDNTFQRQEYILSEMKEAGFITQAQYEEAKAYDVTKDIQEQKKKRTVRSGEFSHLIAEVETRAAEKMMESGKYDTLDNARQALFRGGYSIHTTINRNMQNTVDKILNTASYYPPNISYTITDNKGKKTVVENAMEQSGAALIDNKTGRVLALGGGRNYELDQVNHATRPRQPGSTMKPIAVFGPAIDQKRLGSGTAIDDVPMVWPDQGSASGKFFPMNWDRKFHGLMTARHALEQSYNIPALKIFHDLTPKTGLEYLKRMGVSTITDSDYNLAAGIGGMSQGLTVLEATSTYSTIPNAGVWRDAYMIEEIKDRDGNPVFKHQSKTEQVFDPNAMYILNDMMKGVTVRGTASDLGRKLRGYAIAGKTGTTDDDKDAWYVGYTPDVTLGIWVGYNMPYKLQKEQSRLPVRLWGDIMNTLLPTMENRTKDFFPNPGGVRQVAVCRLSGKLPTELCHAQKTVATELFMAGTEPREQCDVHVKAKYYEINGTKYLADETTPAYLVKEGIFIKRQKYTLPDNNKSYMPLDHALELPGGGKEDLANVHTGEAPGNLTVANTTSSSVTLSWSVLPDAKTYLLLRANQSGIYQTLTELNTTTYTDHDVQAGQSYSYKVVGRKEDGTHSAPSAVVTASPGAVSAEKDELAAPSGLTVKPGAVGIDISWNSVTGASSYTVYRSTEAGGSYQKVASVTGTNHTDIGALPGTTFFYKVTAVNGSQESDASPPKSATVPSGGGGENLPSPPGTVQVSDPKTGSSLLVSWNAAKGAASYKVERSTDGSTWSAVAAVKGTSHADNGLTAGQTYTYRIRSVAADGTTSAPSRTVSETPVH